MSEFSKQQSGARKRKWEDRTSHHGSRGDKRHKGRDLGRNEWSRQRLDKRAQRDTESTKDPKVDGGEQKPSVLPAPFSQDEIAAECRKPKHKVAVMIGYSGSGYKGMQINNVEKTIEGDLFSAFVAVGAISKANADDPKKSALVRCARTDKGVHAAGNVISLKLIMEDDLLRKLNENLSSQIRVWGIQRTVSSFSCYQACDSRWYEYLIPTHAFLPPHPSSYMGKQLVALAEEVGDLEAHRQRQEEVADFWPETERTYIQPILDEMDTSIKEIVMQALYDPETEPEASSKAAEAILAEEQPAAQPEVLAEADEASSKELTPDSSAANLDPDPALQDSADAEAGSVNLITDPTTQTHTEDASVPIDIERKKAIDAATKCLRKTYIAAKRSYRIHPKRLERVAATLTHFLGTQNFHNYTVSKTFRDPSAKRLIKKFTLNSKPIFINGTEWLSIKIHGQSFMMHQIRKMISMIALVVRCGCPTSRIPETFGADSVSIPKVPGLGLLLERPVFDSYNEGAATKFEKEKIDFGRFEKEMEEFKQREIYKRIFREEEEGNAFHIFFNHVDGFKEPQFLFVSSKGIDAVKGVAKGKSGGVMVTKAGFESDDEEGVGKQAEG